MPILHKDMQLCISLAATPSNLGTRFHNYLYDELGLPFVYKAFTTDDIAAAIGGVRALGIRGASISMPFKEAVIPLVDHIEPSAAAIESVNTIVNDAGVLTASNTDYEAIATLIAEHGLDSAVPVFVQGAGGMAKAVVAAFRDAGFGRLTVVARNEATGGALAEKYGAALLTDQRDADADGAILVNATPLGMRGAFAEELAFSRPAIAAAATVFDVVAFPARTPLIEAAEVAGTPTITGAAVIALQAARQFERYTGRAITREQVERASAFSREE